MEPLLATLWIYWRCVARSAELLRHNLLVGLAPIAYTVIIGVVGSIALGLGMIGGMIVALAWSACLSSFLYLIAEIVGSGRANLADFQRGFKVYFFEVVRISFLFWIAAVALRLVLANQPNVRLIQLCITVVAYILFNVVPELIYQSHESGAGLIAASYRFIGANWIEWFPPNVLAAVVILWVVHVVERLPLPTTVDMVAARGIGGILLVGLMVFRGLLFAELNRSSGRSRAFRYRARRK